MWNLGRLTIAQKLIGLLATMMTLIVGVLTAYFPSRQIGELTRGLVNRADTYGAMLASELAPAVAFRDRETAREVLSTLTIDPDVMAAELCLANGQRLYRIGSVAIEPCRAGIGERGRRVLAYPDRVVVTAEVASPEGPHGVLLIELSTARLGHARRTVTLTAVVVGGLVLGLGVLAALLVARSIDRRLRRIVEVASSVTAETGHQRPLAELSVEELSTVLRTFTVEAGVTSELQPIVDTSFDELGTLSRAFNAMLARLRELVTSVQKMAQREQETLANANRILELRVQERTQQLSMANDQLKSEMEQRNKIETELRHAQKLESVGRLAAGVAHEINTPVQFVSDSVHFVRDALRDLVAVMEKLRAVNRAVLDGTPAAEAASEAARVEEAADLEYVFENAPAALDRALDGLDRVATIVRSMKAFAHPDTRDASTIDLNEAIRSTLIIARNEYRYVAELEEDYGELPLVECFAGDINQVILNIVVNASHAIKDVVQESGAKGSIAVRTRIDRDDVVISIGDTGSGIPEDIRERIFDPFFTTKEVGKGTGQGLAISRAVVVEKHGGKLTFESEMGRGTTFFVRIPLRRSGSDSNASADSRGADTHRLSA